MSFTQKFLSFDFSLATGNFGSGGNTYSAQGLRATAEIVKAGGLSHGEANIALYGLPLSVMNQLSTYGNVLTTQGRNSVTISAWETGQQPTVIFQGDIISASFDGQAQPDVPFRVDAKVAAFANAKPVQPIARRTG